MHSPDLLHGQSVPTQQWKSYSGLPFLGNSSHGRHLWGLKKGTMAWAGVTELTAPRHYSSTELLNWSACEGVWEVSLGGLTGRAWIQGLSLEKPKFPLTIMKLCSTLSSMLALSHAVGQLYLGDSSACFPLPTQRGKVIGKGTV